MQLTHITIAGTMRGSAWGCMLGDDTAKGDPGASIWRVKVPGYGWRKLQIPMHGLPYVILTGDNRAAISV